MQGILDGNVPEGAGPLQQVEWLSVVAREILQQVRRAVERAREAGHTWAEIGAVLGISRQAAFQRFGRPLDPRTGVPMTTETLAEAGRYATELFTDVADGRWQAAYDRFDATMTDGLPPDKLADAWAQVTAAVGAFAGLGTPTAFPMQGYTVVDVPLHFEAGEFVGRASYDSQARVAGLYFLAPGQTPT